MSAAVLTAGVNLAVFMSACAAGADFVVAGQPIPVSAGHVATASVTTILAATVVAAFARAPRRVRILRFGALGVAVLSLVGPLSMGSGVPTKLTLALLHLVVTGTFVWALERTLAPTQAGSSFHPTRPARRAGGVGNGTPPAARSMQKGGRPMSKFSPQEIRYLATAKVLGRLATLDRDGQPHVVPVGWRYNAELDTIDISGRGFSATKKFRNARVNPKATFLIDEVLPPWRPRAVMIQGLATTLDGGADREAMIRITPRRVISWGLDDVGSA